jgi:hypothetical protein
VPSRITDRVSLRLDDAPAEPAIRGIMDHHFANQVARQFHSIDREFGSTEAPKTKKGNCFDHAFHVSVRYFGVPAPSESG